MPQPRRHKTNADRQKAYRERLAVKAAAAKAEARSALGAAETQQTPGERALIARVLKAGSEAGSDGAD
jgi:hypothetical protein